MHDAGCQEDSAQNKIEESADDAVPPHPGNDKFIRRLMPNSRIRQLNELASIVFAARLASDPLANINGALMANGALARLANSNCIAIGVIEALHGSNENKISYAFRRRGRIAMKID
jgi:hypothetical protein